MRYIFIWLFVLTADFYSAQNDSALYAPVLRDAVYLSYSDFRHNRGILKSQIKSALDTSQLEFIGKVMAADTFLYVEDGIRRAAISPSAWGFYQNNTLYLNHGGNFYRVPVFGAISYLVVKVRVNNPAFYDPRFGYPVGGGSAVELREFVMDYYDGVLREFNFSELESLLGKDPTLFAEFKKLPRRQQKEQIYRYIRLFNQAHPVYYLKR